MAGLDVLRDGEARNGLERYLRHVYEHECVFKVSDDEVNFIQTGIETLIQSIVDEALKLFQEDPSFKCLYRSVKKFRRDDCDSDIIKVGSFYEGTKNGFPDEFDFLFIIYSSEKIVHFDANNGLCTPNYSGDIQDPLTEAIIALYTVTEKVKDGLKYEDEASTGLLYFDRYMYAKGPSAKLNFVYETPGFKRNISVDLVPAIRQYGEEFERVAQTICPLREFVSEVLKRGSYLYINSFFANYTFTETEMHFMRHVLSKKHVKVYRILKYLINGHGDDERVKELEGGVHGKLYTSYRIKTMMVYHHYQCSNNNQVNIGPCVLKILDDIADVPDIDKYPQLVNKIDSFSANKVDVSGAQAKMSFFSIKSGTMPMLLQSYLKSTVDRLRAMSLSTADYECDRDKLKLSVTGQYLEHFSKTQ